MSITDPTHRPEPITVGVGTTIEVAVHGPDWFPVNITSGRHQTTLYLRRAQLHALRVQLDEIDYTTPQPEVQR
jgi:hypothetical protein